MYFPSGLHASDSHVSFLQAVDLTLCLSESRGHTNISTIGNDISGDSYTWTPSGRLPYGGYALQLDDSDDTVFSHDIIISGGQTTSQASGPSKTSKSGTVTSPSTQPSATGSNSSSRILATGHSSPLASVPASATDPGTTAPIPANYPQSPDVQNIPALRPVISNGAIAGIVVGVVLFLLLTTTTSATLCWRHRRRSSQTAIAELPSHQAEKSDPSATIWIPELDREGAVCGPHELAGTPTALVEANVVVWRS